MDRRTFLTKGNSNEFSSFSGLLPCNTSLPNVSLLTQGNKKVKFYDDLIKGRQVMINMIYATCEEACRNTTLRLNKVYKALGDRMGKDLFMYSITLRPEQDRPEDLQRFAEMHGASMPGRLFLTGNPFDIETIRFALFKMNHLKFDLDTDLHANMLRIINDKHRIWTMVNPGASLYTVLQHISWTDPPKRLKDRLIDNKLKQNSIDKEVKLYGYHRVV